MRVTYHAHITFFDHAPPATQGPSNHRDGGSDEARQSAIAPEIAQTPGLDQLGRLRQWEERTGLSNPTYYRWLQKGRNGSTADRCSRLTSHIWVRRETKEPRSRASQVNVERRSVPTCRLGRVKAEKRRGGHGRSLDWVISRAELLRIQKEGLLPLPKH